MYITYFLTLFFYETNRHFYFTYFNYFKYSGFFSGCGGKEKEKAPKAVEFGFNSVQQMTKVITDINVTENFILIGKEKAQRKSAYFRSGYCESYRKRSANSGSW